MIVIHWPSYNQSLVRRGEILFSYDFLDVWDVNLDKMNENLINQQAWVRNYHFWDNLGLIGIFLLSLVIIVPNHFLFLTNQNLWLFVLILCLSIIIPFYFGKNKTVKIIEKKLQIFLILMREIQNYII